MRDALEIIRCLWQLLLYVAMCYCGVTCICLFVKVRQGKCERAKGMHCTYEVEFGYRAGARGYGVGAEPTQRLGLLVDVVTGTSGPLYAYVRDIHTRSRIHVYVSMYVCMYVCMCVRIIHPRC